MTEGRAAAVAAEVRKVISGKDDVIEKVLTTIISGGHILLEDVPGLGKTTLALAFSRAMGLDFGRVQFTPDVVPSDIVGFTMYNKDLGNFEYRKGAVMCNFFLADEINRTSSKTQSALLEVMQERRLTVDGNTYELPKPFIVMATQNPVGTAGTQMLPEAQLDRFYVRLSMGYPDTEAQIEILKNREKADPMEQVNRVISSKDVLDMIDEARNIYVDDKIYRYVTALAEATRSNQWIRLGVSPRGALALCDVAKAAAFVRGRDFVTPEDIADNMYSVWAHRVVAHPKAGMSGMDIRKIFDGILSEVKAPKLN